jgi:hypothetical protein
MKMLKIIPALAVAVLLYGSAWASPYAIELINYSNDLTGSSLYNDPNAVLGKPSTDFYDSWGSWSGGSNDRKVKLVEPAYNTDADGNKLITTITPDSYITVKFDHQVMDDANNPYGLDFLVFGNAFYVGSGFVNDTTDLNEYFLTGGTNNENVLVSVSQDGENWYDYVNGPFGDTAFPTQGYEYDAENSVWTDNEMDFTKPVDPALGDTLLNGGYLEDNPISAADAVALYEGSGGGTGFDLAESGLEWIQYIKVSGIDGYRGEIDAFSDVAAVPVPGALWLLVSGLLALTGWFRKKG